ncbi:PPC domain-containing protein [Archangium violaceum]|uniref:PPC domain-containing protein n=1 Tax=Archangium violaceum TaxID=83451 RepID=UPI00194F019C|nr:PPC domain-containing protein [Archangium violaceum]QRN99354.1 PPC domain-containing protein [Archangium violaceum]
MHLTRAVSAVALVSMFGIGCGESLPGAEGKVAPQVAPALLSRSSALSTEIYNGYAVTVSGGLGSVQSFRMVNPAPAAKLSFTLRGGSGDADLYVKRFAEPTFTDYDCSSDAVGTTENCVYTTDVESDQPYYVLVYGYEPFSNVTLHAYYSNPLALATQVPVQGNQLSRTVYEVDVPAGYGRLQVTATQPFGPTGQFKLYVRQGDAPAVPSAVDCTRDSSTLPAVCTIINPVAGKTYVMVEGMSNSYACTLRVDVLKK